MTARSSGGARLLPFLAVLLTAAVTLAVVAVLGMPAEVGAPGSSGGPRLPAALADVERVVDGDTVIVRIDGRLERVRYVGINAPELGDVAKRRRDECWAEAARDAHAELVTGREVRLAPERSDRDRFDRLLRHAWVAMGEGWLHVGEALVGAGAAHARSYPPDTGMDERLAQAERAARNARAGLWGACDS